MDVYLYKTEKYYDVISMEEIEQDLNKNIVDGNMEDDVISQQDQKDVTMHEDMNDVSDGGNVRRFYINKRKKSFMMDVSNIVSIVKYHTDVDKIIIVANNQCITNVCSVVLCLTDEWLPDFKITNYRLYLTNDTSDKKYSKTYRYQNMVNMEITLQKIAK